MPAAPTAADCGCMAIDRAPTKGLGALDADQAYMDSVSDWPDE